MSGAASIHLTDIFYWAVPISTVGDDYRAHLLSERLKDGWSRRLCRTNSVVNLTTALVVDSDNYERRCRICLRRAKEITTVMTFRPNLQTHLEVAKRFRQRHAGPWL